MSQNSFGTSWFSEKSFAYSDHLPNKLRDMQSFSRGVLKKKKFLTTLIFNLASQRRLLSKRSKFVWDICCTLDLPLIISQGAQAFRPECGCPVLELTSETANTLRSALKTRSRIQIQMQMQMWVSRLEVDRKHAQVSFE